MDKLDAGEFKEGIRNAVGVVVTYNCDADPLPEQQHQYMFATTLILLVYTSDTAYDHT